MQKKGKLIIAVLILITVSMVVIAKERGKVKTTLKNDDEGCSCHGDLSKNVKVELLGPDTMKPGETAKFLLKITGGPLKNGGTNIAASDGELIPGEGLRLSSGELTHTHPAKPDSGAIVFSFSYTAPAEPGLVTLFANGNSGNGDDKKTGDQWNYAPNKTISIEK